MLISNKTEMIGAVKSSFNFEIEFVMHVTYFYFE